MEVRRRWLVLPLASALGCASMPKEFPERVDGLGEELVITNEIDPAKLEELTVDLEVRVDADGWAMAVAYDPQPGNERLELLPDCPVMVGYRWVSGSAHDHVFDSEQDLFVTPHGAPNTWVRLQRDAHAELRIERVAELDDYIPAADDRPACERATHVISGFALGVRTEGELERLVALTLAPLGTPEQTSWISRRNGREAVGQAVLIGLAGIVFAGAAVACVMSLAEGDRCRSDNDDAVADADAASERAAAARLPAPKFPTHGFELGRTKRVSVETGPGGFTLRF